MDIPWAVSPTSKILQQHFWTCGLETSPRFLCPIFPRSTEKQCSMCGLWRYIFFISSLSNSFAQHHLRFCPLISWPSLMIYFYETKKLDIYNEGLSWEAAVLARGKYKQVAAHRKLMRGFTCVCHERWERSQDLYSWVGGSAPLGRRDTSLVTVPVSRTVPNTQRAPIKTLLNNPVPVYDVAPGEPCPENGRSPGSVSTHHSSPRSDYATYTNSNHAAPSGNASPPEGFTSQSLQTSDVVIHRKENEGFGFVIISSLNRPESGSTISKWQLRLPLNKRSSFLLFWW